MSAHLIDHITDPVMRLPRAVKRAIVLCIDASLCLLSVWLAYYLRINVWVPLSGAPLPAAAASLIAVPIFATFGLYRAVFRYFSLEGVVVLAQATVVYGVIYAAVFTVFGINGVPRTVGIIQPLLLLVLAASTRALGPYLLGGGLRQSLRHRRTNNVLIYGAGSAGRQLAAAFRDSVDTNVVGFIDDDQHLHGSTISGRRVWSQTRLAELVEEREVSEVFLAIPSASRRRRNEILGAIRELDVGVRTLPGLLDIAHGRVTVNDLRPLDIEDLLGRDSVVPDRSLIGRTIRGETVLVTGAGGSIGSELCRQILDLDPARLLLVDASEFALYTVDRELHRMASDSDRSAPEIIPLLGSVCDEQRMTEIFATWRPSTVYHAAAYKHVPLVEHNVVEGLRNNVLGTLICARLAQHHGANSFVLISTDKAVRPTNVMGASKRLSEMILQALAAESSTTCFSMVRFGNVLGSSGSVVPLFRQQIAAGGPITVTHPDITRYFMTIPEASQLVLQAAGMARGGEVFVLDMGEPVRVADLAVRMIELSGLRSRTADQPDGDIRIEFTGLRPGEKLYEELLIGNDPTPTSHPRIMKANEKFVPFDLLRNQLSKMFASLDAHDVVAARSKLAEIVPDYRPADRLVDWVLVASDMAARNEAAIEPEPYASAG